MSTFIYLASKIDDPSLYEKIQFSPIIVMPNPHVFKAKPPH